VYYFENAGHPEVFLASADILVRNMFKRVEACFPVENRKLSDRIIADLELYLKDNTQAWLLNTDGSYHKPDIQADLPISVQASLLDQLKKA
jgi:polyphosphate kinase